MNSVQQSLIYKMKVLLFVTSITVCPKTVYTKGFVLFWYDHSSARIPQVWPRGMA